MFVYTHLSVGNFGRTPAHAKRGGSPNRPHSIARRVMFIRLWSPQVWRLKWQESPMHPLIPWIWTQRKTQKYSTTFVSYSIREKPRERERESYWEEKIWLEWLRVRVSGEFGGVPWEKKMKKSSSLFGVVAVFCFWLLATLRWWGLKEEAAAKASLVLSASFEFWGFCSFAFPSSIVYCLV